MRPYDATVRPDRRFLLVKSNSTIQHILFGGTIAIALAFLMRALAPPPPGQFTPNGPPAPAFSLPRAGSDASAPANLALQDAVQGRKAVLINFWFYS